MKKIILSLLFIPLMIIPGTVISQNGYYTTPVSAWKDSGHDWQTNMVYHNFNGTTYIFSIKDSNPHMYIKPLNATSGTTNFEVGGSNTVSYGPYPLDSYYAPMIAFDYNGSMWFYIMGENDKKYYDTFVQIPADLKEKCNTSYYTYDSKPTHQKLYAFQFDSLLFFITKNTSSNDWYTEEWFWSGSRFSWRKTLQVTGMTESNFGGLIRKIDSLHNPYFIINTYTPNGNICLGKLVPSYTPDGITFQYKENQAIWYAGNTPSNMKFKASTLINGSFKGGNTSSTWNPSKSDQISLFSVYLNSTSNGSSSGMRADIFELTKDRINGYYSGEMQFADGNTPSTSLFALQSAYELVPSDFSSQLPGIDGFAQRNFIYFPFHDKTFAGVYVDSDHWKVDSAKTCFNGDLASDNYDPSVKNLWTLIGIVDGAPPAAVNWPVWTNAHPLATPPTTLTITSTNSRKMSLATTTDDQWSVAGDIGITAKIPEVGKISMNQEIDFATSIKQFTSNSSDTTITLEVPFALFENSQDSGAYIYSIPTIWRYTYSVYPWFDTQLQYPVPNSTQYLYRTLGNKILTLSKPINQSPFNVNDPNSSTMNDWSNRPNITNAIIQYSMSPAVALLWSTGNPGHSGSIDITHDSTTGCETKASFDAKMTIGYEEKIPLIFKMDASVTMGYDISYSTETKVKTTFSDGVKASYENIQSVSDGILVNRISMDLYWFKPETNPNWWFYSGMGTDKPWYLAYIAGTGKSFNLLHPDDKKELQPADKVFAWEPGDEDLSDYTLFIASSPNIASNNIVYTSQAGKASSLSTLDFFPEKGTTYYWSVRAFDKENKPVWAPVWSFKTADDGTGSESTLSASVYPNPGTVQQMKYSIRTTDGKEVKVTLFDREGRTAASKTIATGTEGMVELKFNDFNLIPGVYVAVINNSSEQIIRKIIIR